MRFQSLQSGPGFKQKYQVGRALAGEVATKQLVKPAPKISSEFTSQQQSYISKGLNLDSIRANVQASSSLDVEKDDCRDHHDPADGWVWLPKYLKQKELWKQLWQQCRETVEQEPFLASNLYASILQHSSMEGSLAFILSQRIQSSTLLAPHLANLFKTTLLENPDIMESVCADLNAVFDRDPACEYYYQPWLYFKGFLALQCHRITHKLWQQKRYALANTIAGRMSEVFQVDLHPGAMIGKGILIDHGTGVVIGQTATVGDNVSMLHKVTLGGSGTRFGKRHPTVGNGVLIGAGVVVNGAVTIGKGSKIGAGAVVVQDVDEYCVAVGVPARVVKRNIKEAPVENMEQCDEEMMLDYII